MAATPAEWLGITAKPFDRTVVQQGTGLSERDGSS